MATATTMQKPPPTAKTLIFDMSSKTLTLHPSHPIPTPNPTKDDHLIHVKTTALCSRELEWPIRFPEVLFADNPDKQITPGYDLAGTVITSPPASPFQPGDDIYARTPATRPGNCREYTIARTEEMALKPKVLDWVQAAGVPLSALTAWQALFVHAGLEKPKPDGLDESGGRDGGEKKRVLVTAAAGGVGVWVVQLAKMAGLEVVAQIGSVENDRFVRGLGAAETVNYRDLGLKQWAEKEGNSAVDVVVDAVGGRTLGECWYCVKDGGTLIGILEPPDSRRPEGLQGVKRDVKSLFFIMEPDGRQLAEISQLVDQGMCRPVVDSVWKLAEFEEAFERLDGGHARGKVVVKVS